MPSLLLRYCVAQPLPVGFCQAFGSNSNQGNAAVFKTIRHIQPSTIRSSRERYGFTYDNRWISSNGIVIAEVGLLARRAHGLALPASVPHASVVWSSTNAWERCDGMPQGNPLSSSRLSRRTAALRRYARIGVVLRAAAQGRQIGLCREGNNAAKAGPRPLYRRVRRAGAEDAEPPRSLRVSLRSLRSNRAVGVSGIEAAGDGVLHVRRCTA